MIEIEFLSTNCGKRFVSKVLEPGKAEKKQYWNETCRLARVSKCFGQENLMASFGITLS